MTDYETKSLKLLEKIDQKLGLLVEAAGLTVPEEPVKAAMKISQHSISRARQISARGQGAGWMAR
jgi:hypothetical protein